MENVLLTGGSGGIGQEIVKIFVENGYFVYVIDSNQSNSEKLIKNVGQDKCCVINLNVTDVEGLKNYVKENSNLTFNHVITCAGRAFEEEWKPFEEQSLEGIKKSIEVNLLGHINVIHTFLPLLKKAEGNKSILTISSVNAMQGFGLPAYSSAKAGLYGFTTSTMAELGAYGIRINTLSPGTVETEATKDEPKDFGKLLRGTALGKFASSKDVADLAFGMCVTFKTLTGQNVVLDAGQTKKREI